MARTGKRWLFYATNGFGLGHVTRAMALARQIRARDPSSEILFLTDCEATNLIWREGFATVKIIAFHSMQDGRIDKATATAINRATVATTYAGFRPDVMVVDGPPLGRNGELRGILPNDAHRVLMLREVTAETYGRAQYQSALALYNRVILAHRPGEVEMRFPDAVKVNEVGYFLIRSPEERLSRAEARRRLGLPEEGFVLYVAFGGGGDLITERFLKVVFRQAKRFPHWTLVCALPPFYVGDRPRDPDLRIVNLVHYPMVELMPAFDAAVTMLGDNTMAELFSVGVPSIFLPRLGMDDDQGARARRIVQAGAGWIMDRDNDELLSPLFDALDDPEQRARASAAAKGFVSGNGAARAAEILLAGD